MSKKFTIIPQEQIAEDFLNIVPASKYIPEWYRKSDSVVDGATTIVDPAGPKGTTSTYKKCTPFYDALSIGYMVFLTADIEVTRKPDGLPYILYRTQREIITYHNIEQWRGMPCPTGYSPYVYKWHNPIGIRTPKDYSLLFLNPINRFDLPFQTITGIVDTDVYNLPVQFPFFIKDDFVGVIEKGTPITQIIPIKRDSWDREYEKFNEKKSFVDIEKYLSTIKRSYKTNFWMPKQYK